MSFTVRVLLSAKRDIFIRVENLARKVSRTSATRWLAGIYRAIHSLNKNPLSYPVAEESELAGQELRLVLYGRKPNVYRVLFSVQDSVVSILRVRHAAQDWLTADDF